MVGCAGQTFGVTRKKTDTPRGLRAQSVKVIKTILTLIALSAASNNERVLAQSAREHVRASNAFGSD